MFKEGIRKMIMFNACIYQVAKISLTNGVGILIIGGEDHGVNMFHLLDSACNVIYIINVNEFYS